MGSKRYVICDIEATGLGDDRDLIEIALITWQDDKIIEIYETLINPLKKIPEFISNLTSISNRSLSEAPKFHEVAESIRIRLENAVFVSHNTDFDLGLLRKKYQEMGQDLVVKQFCTLKVAQKEIPGLKNYNLDALCSFFRIKINHRHRAFGDAMATLELFKELIQLHFKIYTKALYLPHHEKLIQKIPKASGLLYFKDQDGQVLRLEAAVNLQKLALEILQIKEANHRLILKTQTLDYLLTGSALIAELKKLNFIPFKPRWMIVLIRQSNGEMMFRAHPYQKHKKGLWYFRNYKEARKKLNSLLFNLRSDKFIYREGGKSKEEILKQNLKIESLLKESRFPNDHLLIIGQGRKLGEKSLVLIKNNHVYGYGHTEETEDRIFKSPELYIQTKFKEDPGADLVAKKYLRVLKNLKQKNERWKSLAHSL